MYSFGRIAIPKAPRRGIRGRTKVTRQIDSDADSQPHIAVATRDGTLNRNAERPCRRL